MTLTITTLESRESPVALQWAFDADPWLASREATIRQAGDSLAAMLSRPGVDVWPVTVTTGPQSGALADAYPVWRPNELTPSSGVIRFDTGGPWDTDYDIEWVVWHELAHAVGVMPHGDDPADLMYPFAPPARESPPALTSSDVSLLNGAGWAVTLPPTTPLPATDPQTLAGYVQVPYGEPGGWVRLTPAVATEWA